MSDIGIISLVLFQSFSVNKVLLPYKFIIYLCWWRPCLKLFIIYIMCDYISTSNYYWQICLFSGTSLYYTLCWAIHFSWSSQGVRHTGPMIYYSASILFVLSIQLFSSCYFSTCLTFGRFEPYCKTSNVTHLHNPVWLYYVR